MLRVNLPRELRDLAEQRDEFIKLRSVVVVQFTAVVFKPVDRAEHVFD
jgi:hypothetical protein